MGCGAPKGPTAHFVLGIASPPQKIFTKSSLDKIIFVMYIIPYLFTQKFVCLIFSREENPPGSHLKPFTGDDLSCGWLFVLIFLKNFPHFYFFACTI
jgi:hypothetical protein